MPPRYLVTGASGFIGTHLIRRLVGLGVDVVAVDVREPSVKLDGVNYIKADVRDLSSVVFPLPIERIYNFAAVHTTPGHQPYEYYDTNIAGATEVVSLASRVGVREIVFTSSISVYGPSELMKTEDSVPAPSSDYGRSKLLAERIHKEWLGQENGRKLTIVRPAVVFGPGERGNFTRLAKLLKSGFFVYPGRKDTIKACIYVEDLLDAIGFAHSQVDSLVIFNGAYPNRYTIEEIVSTLIKSHFQNARVFLVPNLIVTSTAKFLGMFGFLNLGIHPDRVMKLVRSTDVFPRWLTERGFTFPSSLEQVLVRWRDETHGTFE